MENHQVQKTRTGLDRIARAFGISMQGLRAAWLEKAFRHDAPRAPAPWLSTAFPRSPG